MVRSKIMRLGKSIILFLFFFSLLAPPVWAAKMYVIDELVVTVREQKSLSAPTIARLRSLQSVDVIESDEQWAKVRLEDGTQGWIQKKYLTKEPPIGLRLNEIESENQRLTALFEDLKAENALLKKQNMEAAEKLQREQQALAQTKKEYDELNQEASDYLALKEEYEEMRGELETYKAETERLSRTADEALNRRRLKWFLAGAGVLIAGWLIGLASGRRKRSSSKYY
jgi:SH3 domain protein